MAGEGDQAKGRAKKAAGELTDDEELKRDGQADETAGKAKQAVGKAKQKADDAIDSVKDRLS